MILSERTGAKISRLELGVFLLMLAGLATVLACLAWRTGVTVDEPGHLLSAHLYWRGEDRLWPNDMPPGIKIVGGWVPGLIGIPVPYDDQKLWREQQEWDLGRKMMERMTGPQIQRVYFYSRLPLIIFPLLCCGVIWWWAREMFSPRVALLLVLLFCLSPTVLAHGALFKNDLAASFGLLWFSHRGWVYWKRPSPGNAAWLGAGLLMAILAKMSLLILVPVLPLIVVLRHLRPHQIRVAARDLALAMLISYAGCMAAWQFRVSPVSGTELKEWSANPQLPRMVPLAAQALGKIPTPSMLRRGAVSLVESNFQGPGVYLFGNVYRHGTPFYFLAAMAVKMPLPLQLLACGGIALLIFDLARRRMTASDSFWVVPPLVYFAMASMSTLQLGLRLVLPALVFFFLWAGKPVEWLLESRGRRVALAAMVGWLAMRVTLQYPYYIAYFNTLSGGSDNGIAYLSDSNLDWGQNLPQLAKYVREHNIENLNLAYFGNDNPFAYIPPERVTLITVPWGDPPDGSDRFRPKPGYYAVSATLLTGQFFQDRYVNYFEELRKRKPIGKAGYSIYIYKLP